MIYEILFAKWKILCYAFDSIGMGRLFCRKRMDRLVEDTWKGKEEYGKETYI